MSAEPIAIVGAGPAGLAAAYELAQNGVTSAVLEASSSLGGIARTEERNGYRFDIGGHRFYTRVPEISQLWEELLRDDFVSVPRLSRIYYRKRFFQYPLSFGDTVANLGPFESTLMLASYLRARLRPRGRETSFEQWVTNRFGGRLYRAFFKTYTEKVWGMPCDEIMADWAAQRIQDLTLSRVIADAVTGRGNARTLARAFRYPRLGPGMLWERMRDAIEQRGSQVYLQTPVRAFYHDGRRITQLMAGQDGNTGLFPALRVISTIPLRNLVAQLQPSAPEAIREAAGGLRYRALVVVALIVDRPSLFPDNWIYVHEPQVRVGRIQNAGNWSPALVPDPNTSSLAMEYFDDEGGDIWAKSDGELASLAEDELRVLGLAPGATILDTHVVRQPAAYPVYDSTYRERVRAIRDYLAGFGNLQTIGRNGLHRYNNMDHSMLTGIAAARAALGEKVDVWAINADADYGESATIGGTAQ